MKFKVFNENEFELAEYDMDEMPKLTFRSNDCIGLNFGGSWYNLDFHIFKLVKENDSE